MSVEDLTADQRVGHLEGIIADALAAMDGGMYGDARRILTKGKAEPLRLPAR